MMDCVEAFFFLNENNIYDNIIIYLKSMKVTS